MNLYNLVQFITKHPLNKDAKMKSLFRFLKWQINVRLNPYAIVFPFTSNSKLIIKKGMTGVTQNLYCGLHDYEEMFFLLHFLRKENLFLDIGANVGSYTVLAAAHVGAKTISFEPEPNTFSNLLNNISINQANDKVKALNIGLGSAVGSVDFTTSFDTINHVATEDEKNVIKVSIDKLDNIVSDMAPSLIKIDVEGFEFEVLKGANETLAKSELKAILIELNGSGSRYGYEDEKIHIMLTDVGFLPYTYQPETRTLTNLSTYGSHNTIYIRDVECVAQRLKSAEKVKIFDKFI